MAELHLLSPLGFRAAGVYAGIKSRQTPDVGLLVCDTPASAAAVFTTNRVVSPAVKVGREHVAGGRLRAVVVNAGNANACTGRQGERDARRMCALAASVAGCDARRGAAVVHRDHRPPPADGEGRARHRRGGPVPRRQPRARAPVRRRDPHDRHAPQDGRRRVQAGPPARRGRRRDEGQRHDRPAARTPVRRRAARDHRDALPRRRRCPRCRRCAGGGSDGGGIARRQIAPRDLKGAGRRSVGAARQGKPKHATMLAYLTTDAQVPPAVLRRLLGESADGSFNAVTVDDQASTNDTAALLASGASGAQVDSPADVAKFAAALDEVCQSLAYQIAADGEGATKVVVVTVKGAASEADAPHDRADDRQLAAREMRDARQRPQLGPDRLRRRLRRPRVRRRPRDAHDPGHGRLPQRPARPVRRRQGERRRSTRPRSASS